MIDLDALARAASRIYPLPASAVRLAALVCDGTPELGEVAASIAAEVLGQRTAHRPPPETATAALLHDVGKLVMARFLEPALLDELFELELEGATRIEAEIKVLGIDHADPESFARALAELGLTPEELDHLRTVVAERLAEVEARFQ